jgi:hypothetical protein
MLGTRCHECPGAVAPSCDCVRELRAWALSSHGASFPIEPLTPLSPLPLPRDNGAPSRLLQFSLLRAITFPREEAAKVAVTTIP